MSTVLLTGFDPFPGVPVNPSGEIVKHITAEGRPNLVAEVLPTAFQAASARISTLITETRPDAVLMLGVAAGRDAFNLERFALNIIDTDRPDNSGTVIDGLPVMPDGPDAYQTTLPLTAIKQALKDRDVPLRVSNHAGTYVCNCVFYVARYVVQQIGLESRVGFVHIPMASDDPAQPGAAQGLPLATMIDAVRACLGVLGG